MRRILAIAHFTVLEEVRNRLMGATVLFAVILAYFGLVLSQLAAGFEGRFFRDIAYAALEFFGLAVVLQSAYRVVQQDMKKGSSVEMFFVRPVKRWEYLAGRFAGLAAVLAAGLLFLGCAEFALIAVKKFDFHPLMLAALADTYLKLILMLSVCFLMASITTSQASYFASVFLFYLSGHVTHLMRGLLKASQQEGGFSLLFIKPLVYVLPDFSVFSTLNSLDSIIAGASAFNWAGFGFAFIYALIYALCAWLISVWLFSRRELLPG